MKIIEQTKQNVPVLQADGFVEAGGVAHGFSTRQGGVSQGMWASLDLGVSRGDDPDHTAASWPPSGRRAMLWLHPTRSTARWCAI